jgi:hypothetical protein
MTETPTETQESIALVRWMTDHGLVFCHVANERKCSPQEGRIKKAMGVARGFPDYEIFTEPPLHAPARGVFIEMKKRGETTRKPEQIAWAERLRRCGWIGRTCEGAREAVEFLRELGYGCG